MWNYPEFVELFIVEKADSPSSPYTAIHVSTNNYVDYSPGISFSPLHIRALTLALSLLFFYFMLIFLSQ